LNGNNLQVMGSRYFEQLGKSRHGAVRVQNLYQHTGGIKPGKSREVNSRFRMSAAAQYTTCFRLQREDMAGSRKIFRFYLGINQCPDSFSSIMCRNTGGTAMTNQINRNGKSSFV